MKTILLLFLVVSYTPIVASQGAETIEIGADPAEAFSEPEIQDFYAKFDRWVESFENGFVEDTLPEDQMVDDFVIFTETGLFMKDLNDHTAESCKRRILASLPTKPNDPSSPIWIYVSLESHLDRRDLVEMLQFFRQQKIDYYFATDDKIEKIIEW